MKQRCNSDTALYVLLNTELINIFLLIFLFTYILSNAFTDAFILFLFLSGRMHKT